MVNIGRRLHWFISSQIGFDIKKLIRSPRGILEFVISYVRFRKMYQGRIDIKPCLHDWREEAGAIKTEYFWQDLIIAQQVYCEKPLVHVDIGSRLDGFVAHVAAFMPVRVIDVRPISIKIPNVNFTQLDITKEDISEILSDNSCDSLSCLHTIEHFGLGRYGDTISEESLFAGIRNMASLLRPLGNFYVSVPVGIERVEFNANRIFSAKKFSELLIAEGLVLEHLYVFNETGGYVHRPSPGDVDLLDLDNFEYKLAAFIFRKQKDLN